MLTIAFDKHVQLTEEYMSEVFEALDVLYRDGPTAKVLDNASKLFKLRRKHAVWLTTKLDKDLQAFEQALRTIGAHDMYLKNTQGDADVIDRQQWIDKMYHTFAEVLGK